MSSVQAGFDRGGGVQRAAWLHFAGLLALAAAGQVVKTVMAPGAGGALGPRVLTGVLSGVFHLIPVVAGISIGMLSFTSRVVRQAALLTAVTLAIMVALDLGAPAGSKGSETLGAQQGSFSRSQVVDPTDASALKTALAFVRGDLEGWSRSTTSYAPDNPRLRMGLALAKGGYFLLPIVLVGIILGIQAWMAENVTFRTSAAETLGRLLTAWVVCPAAYYLAMSWTHRVSVRMILRSGTLLPILLPLLPFVVVAAIGWWKSWQATRWLD